MKVLITDDVHEIMISGLEKMGFEVQYKPALPYSELPEMIGDFSGIVINSKIKMTREMMDLAPKLTFIARLGSGIEIIDTKHAEKRGIAVFNAPEGNRNAVGEHAMGMLLNMTNKLIKGDREVRTLVWEREENRGIEIGGKTIGIIGFGHTGSSFAQKLAGFNVRVLAYDKYKQTYTKNFEYVKETSLDDVLLSSDVISFHLPLTEETKFMVNSDFIELCKEGVGLINTSRGGIVKTSDLLKHIESGKVGFACLDVFENEKPTTYSMKEKSMYDRLFRLDNVILSPHVAGWTVESKRRLSQVLLNKIDSWRSDVYQ